MTAFSTTRQGGFSRGSYAELNLNAYCGDDPKNVERNRDAVCKLLNVTMPLVIPHQVHGTEIRTINHDFLQLSETKQQVLLEGIDAVMTDVEKVCIGVSTADCIPILLYDPEHHCAAAVHAGWRGTAARIVERVIEAMNEAYHSDPQRIRAVIGPGISLKSFEIGQEVYDAFDHALFPMEQIAMKYDKWHIDLPMCNRLQMVSKGVPPDQIYDAEICTFMHADEYFSARRLGIRSGRIYSGIVLR